MKTRGCGRRSRPDYSRVVLLALCVAVMGCVPAEAPVAEQPSAWEAGAVLATPDAGSVLDLPLCSDPQPALVTDFEVRTPPELEEPAPRVPLRDPVFGTCLVRVTAHTGGLGLKNEYARVQAFNADGSRILVMTTESTWVLYDAASLLPLGPVPTVVEPRWDAEDPDRLYYTDGTRLMAFDTAAGQVSVVRDFADDVAGGDIAAVWTASEGRPSMDTQVWGLMAEDQDWIPAAFLIYDRVADSVTVRDMRGVPGIKDNVDHVTISPLGTHFLASFDRYCEYGELGNDAHPCGLMVYDRELQNGRGLLRIIGHYDVALDAAGHEVVIYQDIDMDVIAMVDLTSGKVTQLWSIDFSHTPIGLHFSGLAYDRPGWALVSTYSGGNPTAYTWMDDQVFAVELTAGGRVVRLAHTRSRVDSDQEHDYWAEPHATVNRDFTRVLFTSNWGRSGTEQVDMYMVVLPGDWLAPSDVAP